MNVDDSITVLRATIGKYTELLEELYTELIEALEKDVEVLGKTNRSAAMVASILESYYTCAETLFLRISQFFENQLNDTEWHKDLLEKMTLTIERLRPRVLSDGTYRDMDELLRFRHFKRYYFSLAYDWERLDLVLKKAYRVHGGLKKDLNAFDGFLEELAAANEE